jgi:glutathione S-transferase
MPLRLFNTARSPFGRKVRIILAEKDLAFEEITVDLQNRTPEFNAVSPLGKVPVLVDGETAIFDSTVVVEYLEDAFPNPPMFGVGVRQRLVHRTLDELGDHIADQAVAAFYAKQRGDVPAVEQATTRIHKALTEVERRAAHNAWTAQFGVGDAAIIGGCGYLVLRHGDAMLEPYPSLRAWLAVQADRPSVRNTAPPAS